MIEIQVYDALLMENDWDIYYWLTRAKTPPAYLQDSPLYSKLGNFIIYSKYNSKYNSNTILISSDSFHERV